MSKTKKILIKLSVQKKPPTNLNNDEVQPYRDKVLSILNQKTVLKKEYVEPLEDLLYLKSKDEAEVLKLRKNRYNDFTNLYMANSRHLIANLKSGNCINNVRFIEGINNGTIGLKKAVYMSPQEMHPDRWKVLLDKKESNIDKATKDPEATTDMFRCGRCHRNRCKYFERQDRSADEPMTLHITCCNCGNYWKQ